ncbi:protein lingerer isoform X3 [Bacillus rossius redtenbacheri]|uniref:protein lingerer isoform X3 n=1 Tax=Bacillus rossius redtenbacheri TaxID=93214 RepID=UPI002FDE2DA5
MSSVNRSTARGGKGAKLDACSSNKTQKSDSKSDSPKSLDPKIQPTAEQMRIAQIIETKFEDADLKDKIKQVMDATRKSEDEVCTALHDCDNDPDRAVNMLLEGMAQGEWETSVKKKKIRQPSTAKSESPGNNRDTDQEDWSVERETNPERERSRTRGGGPPRMRGRGSLDNRGWRGRENKENERNLEDSREGGYRRGVGRMMNGPGRSGRGGRGGGRLGPRTFQSRDKSGFSRPIETWNNPCAEDSSGDALKMGKLGNSVDAAEDWNDDTYDARCGPNISGGNVSDKWRDDFPSPEEWDNEEYTGSLADSKVFTPSGGAAEPSAAGAEPLAETTNVAEAVQPFTAQSLSSSVAVSSGQDVHTAAPQLPQSPIQVSMGTLSAAQSEYLSQFTQPESLKAAVGAPSSFGAANTSYATTPSTAYQTPSPPSGFTATSASFSSTNYVGSSSSYGVQMQEDPSLEVPSSAAPPAQTLPSRTKTQRPRVPPPSKIPSSAVEMPGDAVSNNIAYLDVQFGGLEFGSETGSFDAAAAAAAAATSTASQQPAKYQGSVLDSLPSTRTPANLADLAASSQTSALDGYSSSSVQKSTLVQNQKLSSVDSSILSSSEHGKSSQVNYSQPARVSGSSTGLDMDKNDVGLSYSVANTASYQSYQQSQKSGSSSYQQPASSYSTSNYSSPQVSASTTVFPANQVQMSYASNSQPSSFQTSSYSQASMGYQGGGGGYPSLTQAGSTSTFSAATPAYQGSVYGATQSVYGSYVPAAVSTPHYQNSYGQTAATTTQNHAKLGSSLNSAPNNSQYDAAVATTCSSLSSTNSSTTLAVNVNASPALGLTASQTVSSTSTKVSSSSAGKSSMVTGMPPGVTPIMGAHQYIMSQGGLPYFQQPVYTYEDLQLVQQRIPHMTATGYYDMGFQAPTSLATGREGTLANVAYSMSDSRFARTDNASPVPSTIPQQNVTQAHQQPMLNATTLPPAYAYFYGGGMMPGSFQYGTPALYPMPPATNTHGSSSSTQYAKPGSYSSGYGPGYDGLTQNPDYGKTGYVSASQAQGKAGASAGSGGSSAADLSAPMYGAKSHVALSKVNSYEKQGFHSGTPPPFNMAGSQSTPMTPGGAYGPHLFIPTMPPHQQHHSTQLMHQPLHQEGSGSSTQRAQSAAQPKAGGKQGYSPSYWTPN